MNDPGTYRTDKAIRTAYRDHEFSRTQCIGVALDRAAQASGIHLQSRKIALAVDASDGGRKSVPTPKLHFNTVAGQNVRIRHYLAILARNHAGSSASSSGKHLHRYAPKLFGYFTKGARHS
jgi:hypothetical protein